MALYADITRITANPTEAYPGSMVYVAVDIKNLWTAPAALAVAGLIDYGVQPYPEVIFPYNQGTVDPGQTRTFLGYFTMPNKTVSVWAYSYWFDGSGFVYDEADSIQVVVKGVVYEFSIGIPIISAA